MARSALRAGTAGAAVISVEDVNFDEGRIEEMAASCRVLAVPKRRTGRGCIGTETCAASTRRFRRSSTLPARAISLQRHSLFACTPPRPLEAARFATQMAAISVTRTGLDGIPTAEEIQACMVEVLGVGLRFQWDYLHPGQSKRRRGQDHYGHQPGCLPGVLRPAGAAGDLDPRPMPPPALKIDRHVVKAHVRSPDRSLPAANHILHNRA